MNVEYFLKDYRLRFLFRKYAPKFKEEGYNVSINRRNNRVDCKPATSEASSPSKSGIAGHSIALPNLLSGFPEISQSVDVSDELSDQLIWQFIDIKDDDDSSQPSFEEEKKAP